MSWNQEKCEFLISNKKAETTDQFTNNNRHKNKTTQFIYHLARRK